MDADKQLASISDLLDQLNTQLGERTEKARAEALAMQSEALEIKDLRLAIQSKVEELERSYNLAAQNASRIATEYERLATLRERASNAMALQPPESPVAPKRAVQAIKDVPKLLAQLDAVAGPITEFRLLSGIYFLLHRNEVVYVGQSVSILGRVHQHVNERVKRFDRWCYIEVKQGQLDEVERFYITLLRPKYNKAGKPLLLADNDPDLSAEAA